MLNFQIHALECKYHELYTPIYTKRTTITTGDHEPTDAEAEWPSDSEDEDEGLSEEVIPHFFYLSVMILRICSFQVKEKAKLDEANNAFAKINDIAGNTQKLKYHRYRNLIASVLQLLHIFK